MKECGHCCCVDDLMYCESCYLELKEKAREYDNICWFHLFKIMKLEHELETIRKYLDYDEEEQMQELEQKDIRNAELESDNNRFFLKNAELESDNNRLNKELERYKGIIKELLLYIDSDDTFIIQTVYEFEKEGK